jgi:hypothetical protein
MKYCFQKNCSNKQEPSIYANDTFQFFHKSYGRFIQNVELSKATQTLCPTDPNIMSNRSKHYVQQIQTLCPTDPNIVDVRKETW